MKTRILSLFVLATFLISITANAQKGERAERWQKLSPEQKEMFMQKRKERQEKGPQNFFTEEQKETMKQLRLETAKEVKPLKNQLNELMAKQQTLTTAEKADLKAINKNIESISEVKTQMAKIHAKQHQEIRAMLSEEQLLKFDAMKERHTQGKRGDAMNPRMKRGERATFSRGA